MRIHCPHCGLRDAQEFAYLGDATGTRPDDAAGMHDYVYLRANPAGPHQEFWVHAAGCRAWLRVERDTRTHRILATDLADPGAAKR